MPTAAKTHEEFVERFWARVDRPATEACWEWRGATTAGYGSLRHAGEHYYAHRLSYELAHGPIPAARCVLHRCDNRLCCNPSHHFLGNRADNIQDAASKDRTSYGESHYHAKLNEHSVREIRAAYAAGAISQTTLARRYGVSQMTVSKVCRRVTWTRVD